MQGRMRFAAVLFIAILMRSNLIGGELPSTWIDDAQLNDVQLIGNRFAFAVGEHGAIWISEDGGRTWARSNCGLDVSLQSVCFLTDRIGWIAGQDLNPYATTDGGILLSTTDGGKKWNRISNDVLSPLRYVKFFDPDEGIVVGLPTSYSPSGIFKTNDGGRTWRGVQGEAVQPWKAASFQELERGAVAGVNGRVSLMGGDQLFDSQLPARGLRSVRAVNIQPSGEGWLAGDGGLVLKTSNGGIVWQPPSTALPDELRSSLDFRAVEVRDENVWLAGSPGSVIWHSPDGGQTWSKYPTGQTAPLTSLKFSDNQTGLAVGALGVILATNNGGHSWKAVRGNDRRAAILAMHARPGQTTVPLLTRMSGEHGYRSVVWTLQRDDVGPLSTSAVGELKLQSAVQKCGGNAIDVNWQLPITIPGLENSSTKLTAEWQKQTEGKLPQTMLSTLVRQIRTWRPNVIVIDQPANDDAAGQLLYNAVQQAVGQAADPTRFAEQMETAGLSAWTIDRLYMRLAAGAAGDAHIELDEYLPHLKTSTRVASSTSLSLIQPNRIPSSEVVEAPRIAYRLLNLEAKPAVASPSTGRDGLALAGRGKDFFIGLNIAPGSAARREMTAIDEMSLERMQKLVQKQRNFTAVSQKSLDDPRVAGQMLAQLRGVVEGMDAHQAAGLLRDLADEYRKRSQFDMVESTYFELVQNYPREPASHDAMRWLIQFWCSSEIAWQRSRNVRSDVAVSRTSAIQQASHTLNVDGQSVLTDERVKSAIGLNRKNIATRGVSGSPDRYSAKIEFDDPTANGKKNSKSARMTFSTEGDARSESVNEWHSRAIDLVKKLEAVSPNLARSAEIQFPLAALRRLKGTTRSSDAILRNIAMSAADRETKLLVDRELWTSFQSDQAPSLLTYCHRVTDRPNLDGLLSDPCWVEAAEIYLTESSVDESGHSSPKDLPRTMVMFTYDDEFLYIGVSVPRAEGAPADKPKRSGRKHDADLSPFDRITFRLDLDRDYATWYEFQIDQRGWTSEGCWEDRRWNPQWYVAAEDYKTEWRAEAAIPWAEMTPAPPQKGAFFAVSILRTIPTVGLQSWSHPSTTHTKPSSFGLIKFD